MKKLLLLLFAIILISCNKNETEIEMAALPETEISTTLVKNILGESTTDVGDLCTSNNVNMWAKYKPVSLPYADWLGNPYWHQGSNGMCGLSIPFIQLEEPDYYEWNVLNYLQIRSNLLAICALNWGYDKPTGGADSPFRLGDFRKYEHTSKKFMMPLVSEFYYDAFQQGTEPYILPFTINNGAGGVANVQPEDMVGFPFSSCRLAAVIYDGTTHIRTITAAANMLSTGGALMESDFSGLVNKDYDVFFVFYNASLLRFYPIPDSSTLLPMTLTKVEGLSLSAGDLAISYEYNGVYKLKDEVFIETAISPIRMNSLGRFALKFNIYNEGTSDVENINLYDCIKLSGVSMFGIAFNNVEFELYENGELVPSGSNWNIPVDDYVPVIVRPKNQVIWLDSYEYSEPVLDQTGIVSLSLIFTLSETTIPIVNGTFNYKYTESNGWGM